MVLQLLSDGDWHQIEKLRQTLEVNEYEIEELMGFLKKYGFATIDNAKYRVKVKSDFRKLLVQNAGQSAF